MIILYRCQTADLGEGVRPRCLITPFVRIDTPYCTIQYGGTPPFRFGGWATRAPGFRGPLNFAWWRCRMTRVNMYVDGFNLYYRLYKNSRRSTNLSHYK